VTFIQFQLATLLKFTQGVSLEITDCGDITDGIDKDDARELLDMGLVAREGSSEFVGATDLGIRIIEAALRAANEELRRHRAQLEREELKAKIPTGCMCQGAGWVWRHELPDTSDWDGSVDDTHYDCPMCREREEAANEEAGK
jgi:hypothetical protein